MRRGSGSKTVEILDDAEDCVHLALSEAQGPMSTIQVRNQLQTLAVDETQQGFLRGVRSSSVRLQNRSSEVKGMRLRYAPEVF